jgi:hypothetical protein
LDPHAQLHVQIVCILIPQLNHVLCMLWFKYCKVLCTVNVVHCSKPCGNIVGHHCVIKHSTCVEHLFEICPCSCSHVLHFPCLCFTCIVLCHLSVCLHWRLSSTTRASWLNCSILLSAVFHNQDNAPHSRFLKSALSQVNYSRPSPSFGHIPSLWVINPRLEQFCATRVLVVYLTTSLLLFLILLQAILCCFPPS